MTPTDRFREMDDAALHNALLALGVCPTCRNDLLPVAFCADTFGCARCKATHYTPQEPR